LKVGSLCTSLAHATKYQTQLAAIDALFAAELIVGQDPTTQWQ